MPSAQDIARNIGGGGGILGAYKGSQDTSAQNPQSDYKKWGDIPWWERGIINVGSGFEDLQKKLYGVVGAEDYAFSGFTDEKEKMKRDFSLKGGSSGWDWNTFLGGNQADKVIKGITGDDSGLDDSLPSSLKTGSGISGGGVNSMDNLSGRLGLGGQQGGNSLGKALAVEQDPALDDKNFNRNNFSF